MHRFIEILKSHPYAIGAGVLIGAFLIYMMSRSGSATGGTYAAQPQNSEVELATVNAQLVASQDATRMQGNLAQIALQAKQTDDATALATTQSNNATAITINSAAQKSADLTNTLQYNLAAQKEYDTNNLSLLTLAGQDALAASQQGYTAELASQAQNENYSANIQDANYAAVEQFFKSSRVSVAGSWGAAFAGGVTPGHAAALLGSVGSTAPNPDPTTSTISAQATAAQAVSNAALQAIYNATLHLTGAASNAPLAPIPST